MKQAVESTSDRMRRMRESSAAEPKLTLAERINAAHFSVEEFFQGALKRAVHVGELLIEAKQQVKHGQWLPWLKQNCPKISDRTAQQYMQLAANTTKIADLDGIASALKFLSGYQESDEEPRVRALPVAKAAPISVNRPLAALPAPAAPRPAETIIDAEFEEVEEAVPGPCADGPWTEYNPRLTSRALPNIAESSAETGQLTTVKIKVGCAMRLQGCKIHDEIEVDQGATEEEIAAQIREWALAEFEWWRE
jgi:hypothetical protein